MFILTFVLFTNFKVVLAFCRCGDAAASPQLTFYIFKFLNSVTLTRKLRAP